MDDRADIQNKEREKLIPEDITIDNDKRKQRQGCKRKT
jgi:hypothetical protein